LEYQSQFAAIVESSQDAIVGKSLDGVVTSWNAAAERFYGYTSQEAIGRSIYMIVPPERTAELADILDRIRRGVRVESLDTERLRKDGTRIAVSVTISPVRDAAGHIVGASAVARDISGRRQAEREREQSRLLAEAANRAKSEFLANVSHELRTPMTAIIGMTDLALNEELPAAVRNQLSVARQAADQLMQLLNALLDYAGIEAGKLQLRPQPFRLGQTVRKTVATLAARAQKKGLVLRLELSEDVPDDLVGDAGRLEQVLTNLLDNAIKFTERGEVAIAVTAAWKNDAEVRPLFTVSDTGIGIAAQDQRRIFSPFTQVDAARTRRFQGTGLGLAVSRELVKLMGGRLWVESRLGGGSRFRFTARFGRGRESAASRGDSEGSSGRQLPSPEAPAAGPATMGPPERKPHSLRILLAEDMPANQRLIVSLLERRGHQVQVADEGQEAIDWFQRMPFDLIIMDVQMPNLDGLQATGAIRRLQHAGEPRIPIVALTAHAMKGDRERCLEAGMDAYLSKPINAQQLIELVETLSKIPKLDKSPEPAKAEPRAAGAAPEPRAAKPHEPPLFDYAAAIARLDNDENLLDDMIRFFHSDAPELLRQIRAAIDANNAEEMMRAAHSLKGLAATFDAKTVVAAGLKVEELAKSGKLTEAEDAVALLELEAQRLSWALADFRPHTRS
jgi:PAS domain S-box-containing protein